jgi:uncharacterized protein YndB with AHSA1/START domain
MMGRWHEGEYREIVPNERIVTTEVFETPEAPPDELAPLNIVTFSEADRRTTLSLLVQTANKALRDMILDSGMQESMDILEQVAISLR